MNSLLKLILLSLSFILTTTITTSSPLPSPPSQPNSEGYTGTILLEHSKLSELIKVRWLAQEVRQLANSRQITVLNGSYGQTDVSSLILLAVTVCALGYGYMWWKGLSISDLMYVTKRNMAPAVTSVTENWQSVNKTLEKEKKHLLQRVENLDGKIDEQKDLSKLIMSKVRDARGEFVKVNDEFNYLTEIVEKLEFKKAGKSRGLLPSSGDPGLQIYLCQTHDVVEKSRFLDSIRWLRGKRSYIWQIRFEDCVQQTNCRMDRYV